MAGRCDASMRWTNVRPAQAVRLVMVRCKANSCRRTARNSRSARTSLKGLSGASPDPSPTDTVPVAAGTVAQCHFQTRALAAHPCAGLRYSITLSAHSNIDCGIVNPIARAVLRFTTMSNLAGWRIGISRGCSPSKILTVEPTAPCMSSQTSGL